MVYKDRKHKRSKSYLDSFSHAIHGFKTAFLEERNMRFHLVATLFVILCGFFFHITKSEWLLLLLVICLVIALELVNTAIERAVDVATKEFLPEAKKAKDVAAAAVLLASLFSVIIGLIIFIPYVF